MKTNTLLLFCIVLLSGCIAKRSIKSNKECDLLNAAIRDIMLKDSLSEIRIGKEYLKWDTKIAFDFIIGKDLPWKNLPSNEEERIKRLKSAEIDPYPMYYLFAFPFTDTLFTKEDRIFMKEQAADSTLSPEIRCDDLKVEYVDNKKEVLNRYVFYRPIFNKNHTYGIVRRFAHHRYFDNANWGELQTFYYKYDSKKGWMKIFESQKWQ